jgi:hypothetical protein
VKILGSNTWRGSIANGKANDHAANVALALALGGCGNSKKGNGGYGDVPLTHPVASIDGHEFIG